MTRETSLNRDVEMGNNHRGGSPVCVARTFKAVDRESCVATSSHGSEEEFFEAEDWGGGSTILLVVI